MRSFIYGRYDVLQGVRGYEVFKHDRALNRDTVREIDALFSSRDPDFKILPVLGDFFVYYPLSNGDWIFGRGSVEERGEYYSYVVHGVVLDAGEQATLYFNPFLIADRLTPRIGDKRELPAVPLLPNPSRPDYFRFLAGNLASLLAEENASLLLYVVGDITTRLLERTILDRGERLVFPYDRRLDARAWSLVWFLLPETERRKISLSSLAPFLLQAAHISGSFDRNEFASNHCVLLEKPERTPLGTFLFNQADRSEEELIRAFEVFSAAAHDCDLLWDNKSFLGDLGNGRQAFYLDYLKGVLKGLETPSLLALDHWCNTLAHLDLFKWKAWFLLSIWRRNHLEFDTSFREDLEQRIIGNLVQNLEAINVMASLEPETYARRLKPHLDHLIEETRATSRSHMALPLLTNELLAEKHMNSIDDRTVALALWQTSAGEFEKGLRNRLKYKENWGNELNILFRHPHFPLIDPQLCALIFDLLHQQGSGTRELIELIVENKFARAPAQFQIFLKTLDNLQGMMSRFVVVLRAFLVRDYQQPARAEACLELLEICRILDATTLSRLTCDWINHRQVEFLAPFLSRKPALLAFFLKIWLDQEMAEDAQLRYCWLVTRHCGGIHLEPRIKKAVSQMLKDNPAFGFFLGQGAVAS